MLQSFQQRYWLVSMSALAVFICYIDRVNISVAIIPMAETHGWSPQTQGLVLSSFFVGYLLLQIVGGRLSDRFGGKVVLGWGVLLWSPSCHNQTRGRTQWIVHSVTPISPR